MLHVTDMQYTCFAIVQPHLVPIHTITRGEAMAETKFSIPKLPAGASRGGAFLFGAAIIGYGLSKSVYTGRKQYTVNGWYNNIIPAINIIISVCLIDLSCS